MVMARKAIEATYTDVMTITNLQETEDQETGETKFAEVQILQETPCRISFGSVPPASKSGEVSAYDIAQPITLFVSPDVEIKAGCTIHVTRCNVTKQYHRCGKPALYPTHQETALELVEDRA